ncbi:MAG: hypothetical protein IKB88_11835 [Clostridia bacterium]|nr:hypothetical protein [Clostridia bacterium]
MFFAYLIYMGPSFLVSIVADLILPDKISQPIFDFFYNNATVFWDFVDKIFGVA